MDQIRLHGENAGAEGRKSSRLQPAAEAPVTPYTAMLIIEDERPPQRASHHSSRAAPDRVRQPRPPTMVRRRHRFRFAAPPCNQFPGRDADSINTSSYKNARDLPGARDVAQRSSSSARQISPTKAARPSPKALMPSTAPAEQQYGRLCRRSRAAVDSAAGVVVAAGAEVPEGSRAAVQAEGAGAVAEGEDAGEARRAGSRGLRPMTKPRLPSTKRNSTLAPRPPPVGRQAMPPKTSATAPSPTTPSRPA